MTLMNSIPIIFQPKSLRVDIHLHFYHLAVDPEIVSVCFNSDKTYGLFMQYMDRYSPFTCIDSAKNELFFRFIEFSFSYFFHFVNFWGKFRHQGHLNATVLMKIMLSACLRKYKFTTNLKMSDLELKYDVTLKLVNKHMVSLEKRVW